MWNKMNMKNEIHKYVPRNSQINLSAQVQDEQIFILTMNVTITWMNGILKIGELSTGLRHKNLLIMWNSISYTTSSLWRNTRFNNFPVPGISVLLIWQKEYGRFCSSSAFYGMSFDICNRQLYCCKINIEMDSRWTVIYDIWRNERKPDRNNAGELM